MYRDAPIEALDLEYLEGINPLDWWKENHIKYPHVWVLAKCYLPVPATSAPSKQAFSVAGNVITLRRCHLNVDLVDDIVHLRENEEKLLLVRFTCDCLYYNSACRI